MIKKKKHDVENLGYYFSAMEQGKQTITSNDKIMIVTSKYKEEFVHAVYYTIYDILDKG